MRVRGKWSSDAGHAVTCRTCGAEGRETSDDPCPDLCADCFGAAMLAAFGPPPLAFTTDPGERRALRAKLRLIGFRPQFIDAVIADMMAAN